MNRFWNKETDVLVVGSGFAGLSSALEAYNSGAAVVILEKRRVPGGNSIISGGGYNAVDPERQLKQGIEDSIGRFYEDTMRGGDYRANSAMVRILVENALEGLHWLEEKGVVFDRKVNQVVGSLWPRCHKPIKPTKGGAGIIRVLLSHVKEKGIPLLLEHRVTGIIRENALEGKVLGVEVVTKREKLLYRAKKAVILASGGFGADTKMLTDHDPRLKDFETTNHPDATGECIVMAQDVGACVIHMDFIQCLPNAAITVPPNMAIFVDGEGKRFIAEDERRTVVCEAILRLVDKRYFVITDAPALKEQMGISFCNSVKHYVDVQRPVFGVNTIKELEAGLEMPDGNLAETVANYNRYVDRRKDPEFGKASHMLNHRIDTPPFFCARGRVAVHYTCGGLMIEPMTCQVMDRRGETISGLYAAGEVTGGIDGTDRVGSNATPMCIVFGRICGKKAAE